MFVSALEHSRSRPQQRLQQPKPPAFVRGMAPPYPLPALNPRQPGGKKEALSAVLDQLCLPAQAPLGSDLLVFSSSPTFLSAF